MHQSRVHPHAQLTRVHIFACSITQVQCTLAAAAGALAEVSSHHEVRPALVKVALLVAPVLAGRRVVAAQLCMAEWGEGEQSDIQLQHAAGHHGTTLCADGALGTLVSAGWLLVSGSSAAAAVNLPLLLQALLCGCCCLAS